MTTRDEQELEALRTYAWADARVTALAQRLFGQGEPDPDKQLQRELLIADKVFQAARRRVVRVHPQPSETS